MKAQELRIGNIVGFISEKYPSIVMEIYRADEDYMLESIEISSKNSNASRLISNFCPIKITQELLEKCGFKEVIHEYPHKEYIIDGIFRLSYSMAAEHEGIYVFDCYAHPYDEGVRENEFYVEVTSLHQLQNLYFSLTNHELSLQL